VQQQQQQQEQHHVKVACAVVVVALVVVVFVVVVPFAFVVCAPCLNFGFIVSSWLQLSNLASETIWSMINDCFIFFYGRRFQRGGAQTAFAGILGCHGDGA
jgi:hypothetical protein